MRLDQEFKINKMLADFDGIEYQKPKEGDTLLFDIRNTPIDYSCDYHALFPLFRKLEALPEMKDYSYWNVVRNLCSEFASPSKLFTWAADMVKFCNSKKNTDANT